MTKGLVALCLLMLADRGKLDYDRPVADYWPEFGAHGKQAITVRDLLNHRAGLAIVDEPLPLEDWCRAERVGPVLARQRPAWKPGSDQGYGAISAGAYAAELFRRVAGRSVGRFFAEEVARPLGTDVFIGLPADLEPRVATIYPAKFGLRQLELVPEILTGRTVEGRILRALLKQAVVHASRIRQPAHGAQGPAALQRSGRPRAGSALGGSHRQRSRSCRSLRNSRSRRSTSRRIAMQRRQHRLAAHASVVERLRSRDAGNRSASRRVSSRTSFTSLPPATRRLGTREWGVRSAWPTRVEGSRSAM